ncbi:MAG: hypothetical protein RR832_05785 [Bacilli bacterium]
MFSSGYIGTSRSVRSRNAIDEMIMPLSLITKDVLDELLYTYEVEDKVPLNKFKRYVESNADSEWHHTGKFFNETTHYDLNSIFCDKTSEEIKDILKEIKSIVIEKKEKVEDEQYYLVSISSTEWIGNYKNYKTPVTTNYECYTKKSDSWAYSLDDKKKFNMYANKNVATYLTEKQVDKRLKEKIKKNKLKIKNIIYR